MFLPLFSGRLASSVAAYIDAPLLMPTRRPSVLASSRLVLIALSYAEGVDDDVVANKLHEVETAESRSILILFASC